MPLSTQAIQKKNSFGFNNIPPPIKSGTPGSVGNATHINLSNFNKNANQTSNNF